VPSHVYPTYEQLFGHGSGAHEHGGGGGGGGGPGATGVTEFEALDVLLTPYPVTVVTVNVYAVPFDKPLTVMGEDAPEPVAPPGLAVTTYVALPFPS